MRVEGLKNYGRPFSETMTGLPPPVEKRIRREGMKVLRRHLGLLGVFRLLFLTWREKRRMLGMDLDAVRRRGLDHEKFIELMLRNAAMFFATVKLVGMQQALAIHREIMERIACPMNEALGPSSSQFQRMEDPFGAFRDYLLAFFQAEQTAGLHEYRIRENSDDAIAIDVTYCAFCEIPKQLGIIEACEPGCYSDEVFFPEHLEPLGLRFVRTQTLARGGDHCDFRFERVS